jgi:hypothetical protein
MMKKYGEFISESKNNGIRLYHGSKSGNLFDEFDFLVFPYFYLTPNYQYALYYSKGIKENVMVFEVEDGSNIIDLTGLGVKVYNFQGFQKVFYKRSGLYFPVELGRFFPCSLWEVIRLDSDGLVRKRLRVAGKDGIKMMEVNSEFSDGEISYVIVNNRCIRRVI